MVKNALWVGLDVGAETMNVCVTDDAGAVVSEHWLEATAAALHPRIKGEKRRIKLIALESGSCGIRLCRSLRRLGYPVAVFNARQASRFLAIRRNKTDKNDARGLADLARLNRGSVSEVLVKSPECQRLRSTLVTRQKLVRLRTVVEGSMRSLLRLNGGKLRRASTAAILRRNVAAELQRIRNTEKLDLSDDIKPLLELGLAARTYIETLDHDLREKAAANSVCQRFLEIPGVGPLTALSFYAAIENPDRFTRNSDVGAYLGLVPTVRQSGHSVARLRISKMGDRMTRSYLTSAALLHVKHADTAIAEWGAMLSERLGKRGVQSAVARKLAITMLAMWKSGQSYDPHPRSGAYSVSDVCSSPKGAAGWETAASDEDVLDPVDFMAQPADTGKIEAARSTGS